jgi:RNA-directed DNA polymerase
VRFPEAFKERLAKFGLELHPDKTRLIEFGRYAARKRKRRGEGKPETFNFLGFTHICGQRHKTGTFTVWRITAKNTKKACCCSWLMPACRRSIRNPRRRRR